MELIDIGFLGGGGGGDVSSSSNSIFTSSFLDNDLGFLDSSADSSDFNSIVSPSEASGGVACGSSIWGEASNNDSQPSRLLAEYENLNLATSLLRNNNNNGGIGTSSMSDFASTSTGTASSSPTSSLPTFNPNSLKLNPQECIQIMQYLSNSLAEADETKIPQIVTLMQTVQGQLMQEIHSPLAYGMNSCMNMTNASSPLTPSGLSSSSPLSPSITTDSPVELAAMLHKNVAGRADAPYTWSGQLPPRILRNPVYSPKVFLGGLPYDITEMGLIQAFKPYGNVRIEWPTKDAIPPQRNGFVYVIFENEKQVKLLLQNCFLDYSKSTTGDWYYKLSSRRLREKEVQVIPWAISDSSYVKCQASKIDGKRTIFVGALHGMLNAEGLAKIMNDLFGGVIYAGIDTDRNKYPIGSGRVTFNNVKSYVKAISAGFVEIKTKFRKTVQVDPYVEDSICSNCNLQQGPYFCREWSCFKYFCRTCYQSRHNTEEGRNHRPIMRNANKPQSSLNSSAPFAPVRNRNNYNRTSNNNDRSGYYHNNNYNHHNNHHSYPPNNDSANGSSSNYNIWNSGWQQQAQQYQSQSQYQQYQNQNQYQQYQSQSQYQQYHTQYQNLSKTISK